METTQTFALGSAVKVVRCEICPGVVGRVANIKAEADDGRFQLNFGRGRPQRMRPEFFNADDLELVNNS